MPAFCMTNARAASSGVPEYGCEAKSYITSGEPPKSFQRMIMFGEFTDVLKVLRASSCADVAWRTFGKCSEAFKSKFGAGRLYSSFTISDAALPVSNGSETIAPKIAAAAVSKIANRKMLFLLSVLLVSLILPPKTFEMVANNVWSTAYSPLLEKLLNSSLCNLCVLCDSVVNRNPSY